MNDTEQSELHPNKFVSLIDELREVALSWGEESVLDKNAFADPASVPWAAPGIDIKPHTTRTWYLQTHENGNADLFLLIDEFVIRHITFEFERDFDFVTYSVTTYDMHSNQTDPYRCTTN